jgi:MoaA/NifB/PqqE/SkfB family radical SAM enzyme
VRTFHFCGGEPTIHPGIVPLIDYVHGQGGKTRMTTNGIAISEDLIAMLQRRRTEVKFSLHGDRAHHDAMVGRKAFDRTTENLRWLLAARVPLTVQTTIVAGGEWVVDWMASFCKAEGVRRLSILPFLPRGSGNLRRGEYELSEAQRRRLRALVSEKRKALSGRLEVRWLDFTARPVTVIEADGRVLLEGATESLDRVLFELPAACDRTTSIAL